MLLALLTSIGVDGIPAASLVAITVILGAVGLVNVFSNACGAVVIGRLEGERGILEYPLA